jgi:hypothetical protein
MKTLVVVLTVLAALLGAGGGFVVGFIATVIDRVHTDQLGCALPQTAESAGYLWNGTASLWTRSCLLSKDAARQQRLCARVCRRLVGRHREDQKPAARAGTASLRRHLTRGIPQSPLAPLCGCAPRGSCFAATGAMRAQP